MSRGGPHRDIIKELLGHESVDITVKYLGINPGIAQDHMSEAMQRLDQYRRALICPREGIIDP